LFSPNVPERLFGLLISFFKSEKTSRSVRCVFALHSLCFLDARADLWAPTSFTDFWHDRLRAHKKSKIWGRISTQQQQERLTTRCLTLLPIKLATCCCAFDEEESCCQEELIYFLHGKMARFDTIFHMYSKIGLLAQDCFRQNVYLTYSDIKSCLTNG
jgi:hypothetical protein